MEPTQLMIKVNLAVQSNKDTQQKNNVPANAESKSFDQILSLFNMVQVPDENGVSEKTPSINGTEMTEDILQNPNSLSEEDWKQLDTILHELFGLYQQVLPNIQPTGHFKDGLISISMSQSEGMVGQSIQQVIGEVHADLGQWLQKAGGIEQLSYLEKKQLIDKITQFANNLTTLGKINQNISIEIQGQLEQTEYLDAPQPVEEQVNTANSQASVSGPVPSQAGILNNQTADSEPVHEQAAIPDRQTANTEQTAIPNRQTANTGQAHEQEPIPITQTTDSKSVPEQVNIRNNTTVDTRPVLEQLAISNTQSTDSGPVPEQVVVSNSPSTDSRLVLEQATVPTSRDADSSTVPKTATVPNSSITNTSQILEQAVAIPVNQTTDPRLAPEHTNILEQILRLFGIEEKDLSPVSNTKPTNEALFNPHFSRQVPKLSSDVNLDKSFMNNIAFAKPDFQMVRPVMLRNNIINNSNVKPLQEPTLATEMIGGSFVTEEIDGIQIPKQINQPIIDELQAVQVTESDSSKITTDPVEQNTASSQNNARNSTTPTNLDIEVPPVNTKTEQNNTIQVGITQNANSTTPETLIQQDKINHFTSQEQVSNEVIQNPQKQSIDPITTSRVQTFMDASLPPEKRKIDGGILNTVPHQEIQAVQVQPTNTAKAENINNQQHNQTSAIESVIAAPKSEVQTNQPPPSEQMITSDVQQQEVTEIQQLQQREAVPIRNSNANTVVTQQTATLTLASFVPEVSEWMGRFFKISKDLSGLSEARFSLYPKHLGQLQIKIAAQKGQITAQIVTDTQVAKEALEGQLSMLKQALQQQGLQVQKIEIIQHVPTAQEFNQGNNNTTFSQGGGNQQQYNQHHEQEPHSASKAASNTTDKDIGQNPVERDNTMPSYTYGGTQVRTASRIDFTA
ncbi:flagellar hook-length control protein FliK [Bacillus marasmi]|uniref:flagellar hook-length control protein FliK n=1 Tax=Bacillus marasmi TaxID=1926279 RepID=UPI00164E1B71|nr:flagellar hook-length control protein FliK [Bacillus marasmi]